MFKKLFVVSVLFALAAPAFADIPMPPRPEGGVDRMTVGGADASELANSLPGAWIIESALRTLNTHVKTFRTESGALQISCRSSYNPMSHMAPEVSCAIEKSRDGSPLPRVIVHPRMG